MSESVLAWHFVGDTLRDGRPVPPDGEWLVHNGEVVPGQSGLHASERIIDALQYAPGSTICRVELRGDLKWHEGDKVVGRERLILWRVDGEALLRAFAWQCALDVLHLWDAPEVVRRYLETGDESIRDDARAVARADAMKGPRTAVRDVARDIAQAAAGAAAWAAARVAARDAAVAAGWDAARAVTRDPTWTPTREAAWAVARAAQNKRLTEMAEAERMEIENGL